jgi:hypothetical protein
MYEWRKNLPLTCTKAAQLGIAVDRFAREIGGILKVIDGALAATECQSVGPEASPRSDYCLCSGSRNTVAEEEANRTWSRSTLWKLSRLATVSQTHSNALSGHVIEGLLTSEAISGNAFERHHTQRNRVPSRLARTVEESM